MKKIRITLSDEDHAAFKTLSETFIPEGEDGYKNTGKTILFFAWLGANFAAHSAEYISEDETKTRIKSSLQVYNSLYKSGGKE